MKPTEHRHAAEALFLDALDLPPVQREAFLQQRCADDPALEAEVRSLLAAHEGADAMFNVTLANQRSAAASAMTALPEQVGTYKVVAELGRGGMGTVYRARHEGKDFQREVAVKVVTPGLRNEHILERFLHERKILASLNHPNIARLLDGGQTEDGRPFFVMELVEGVPITQYCDDRKLSVDERLQLFQTVCQAVHYAHQNLIVHRDLKPSNILVTEEGIVKLLDFGIAKLIEEGEDTSAPHTRTGFQLMTPEYASPEQVTGDALTTSSDVYALGVLLYELLTGHRPYRLNSRVVHEIARIICDEEPERPSTAVSRVETIEGREETTTISPDTVSEARSTHTDKLRRRLAGDLDNIVLMAMRKEPDRRYGSAQQMAEDVRRHLSGLPVVACRDTVRYRAQKFVQRHPWGVAATVLALVLLSGFSLLTWQQSLEIAQERDRAEEVSDFLVEVFSQSDPFTTGDASAAEMTARELLDRGAARLADDLTDQPVLQARLALVMGRVYQNLGLHEENERLARESLALLRAHEGDSADVAAALLALGIALREDSRLEEAEAVHREALALTQETFGQRSHEVARAMNLLAIVYRQQDRLDEAENHYRAALRLQRRAFGKEHLAVAQTMNNLAILLQQRDRFDEAEALKRESLAIRQALLPENDPRIAQQIHDLARTLDEKGDDAAAEQYYQQALAMQRSALGDDHKLVARTLRNYGSFLMDQGRYAEAEQNLQAALSLEVKIFGEVSRDVAKGYNNLSVLKVRQGDYRAAEELIRKALAIRTDLYGPNHASVASAKSNLAGVLARQGLPAEAEVLYREVLALRQARYGSEHRSVAQANQFLAIVLMRQGKLAEAAPRYEAALAIQRAVYGDAHPVVAQTQHDMATLQSRLGNPETAERLHREALALRRQLRGDEHPDVLQSLQSLGRVLTRQAQFEEAERLLTEGVATSRATLGDEHPRTANLLRTLAQLHESQESYAEAEPLFQEALRIFQTRQHRDTTGVRADLDALYAAWGRPATAMR